MTDITNCNQLGTVPLGKIKEWQDTKASSITPVPFPGQDSGLTEGIDTLGVIAYINIGGRWTGSFHDIQAYIFRIKAIVDGMQTSATRLRSPYLNMNAYKSGSTYLRMGQAGYSTSYSSGKLIDTNATFITQGIGTATGGPGTAIDIVKNLLTGEIVTVTSTDSETQVTLSSNIITSSNTPYAITASVYVKVLSIEVNWELPGLSWCDYRISLMQVKEV